MIADLFCHSIGTKDYGCVCLKRKEVGLYYYPRDEYIMMMQIRVVADYFADLAGGTFYGMGF